MENKDNCEQMIAKKNPVYDISRLQTQTQIKP